MQIDPFYYGVNGYGWNAFAGVVDTDDSWLGSIMAAQSRLGILSQWRARIGASDIAHSCAVWSSTDRVLNCSNSIFNRNASIMNRLFSFVLFLVVIVLCVGFFRGWFSLSANNEMLGNKLDVNFKVDRDKMQEDAKAIQAKTKSLIESDK